MFVLSETASYTYVMSFKDFTFLWTLSQFQNPSMTQ